MTQHSFRDQSESKYTEVLSTTGFAIIGVPNKTSALYALHRRLDSHIHEFKPKEFKKCLGRYFKNVFLFFMTNEKPDNSFNKMAWYLMAICTK